MATTNTKTSKGSWVTLKPEMLDKAQAALLKTLQECNGKASDARKAFSAAILKDHTAPSGKQFIVNVKGGWISLGLVDATAPKGDKPATLADWLKAQGESVAA